MYDWGDRAQHSAAAYEIIKQAKAQKEGEKLNVIALGALTNVASAIFIDPSIAKNIKLYWLGTTYDFEKSILRKDDFNCAMDQYALTHLLFSEVEMHIIPVSVASKMTFDYSESREKTSDQSSRYPQASAVSTAVMNIPCQSHPKQLSVRPDARLL